MEASFTRRVQALQCRPPDYLFVCITGGLALHLHAHLHETNLGSLPQHSSGDPVPRHNRSFPHLCSGTDRVHRRERSGWLGPDVRAGPGDGQPVEEIEPLCASRDTRSACNRPLNSHGNTYQLLQGIRFDARSVLPSPLHHRYISDVRLRAGSFSRVAVRRIRGGRRIGDSQRGSPQVL